MLLRVEGHPLLVERFGCRPGKMRVMLAKVLYHCDLQNMYESHDSFGRENERFKRKAQAQQQKLVGRSVAGALAYDGVLRSAMQQHMLVAHDDADKICLYSCSAASLCLQSVAGALDEPETKKQRLTDEEDAAEMLPDVDLCERPGQTFRDFLQFQCHLDIGMEQSAPDCTCDFVRVQSCEPLAFLLNLFCLGLRWPRQSVGIHAPNELVLAPRPCQN